MQKSLKKYFPVFALPTLVAFTIGFIVPFLMGIYLSFCKFTTVTDAKFVGISNYFKIFTDEHFHIDRVHLDDQETAGDFHLFYVPFNNVKKLLKKTINDNPRNKLITEEMIIALKEWKKTNG